MALVDFSQSAPLPCGSLLDDLIAQVTDGAPPLDRAHQAACRYCEAALQAIQEAWEEFQQLARTAVAVPEDLAGRVMSRVRALARGDDGTVILTDGHGQTRVADSVLAQLARTAAIAVADVHWVSVQAAGESTDELGGVAISLRLVAAYGPDLLAVAAEVRRRVAEVLTAQTGAVIARIDVAIEDVVLDGQNF